MGGSSLKNNSNWFFKILVMTDQRVSGSVLVEFILIMPLAILICLAAIDLSRAMRTFKIAATMSREIANIVYRECVTSDVAERNDCLDNAFQSVQDTATDIANGSQVLVTLFIEQPDGSIGPLTRAPGGIAVPFQFNSTADLDTTTGGGLRIGSGNIDSSIRDRQAVVVGEAYVPFQPIVPFFSMLLNGGNKMASRYFPAGMVHEVTIF